MYSYHAHRGSAKTFSCHIKLDKTVKKNIHVFIHAHWGSAKTFNGHIKLDKAVKKIKRVHTTFTGGLMTEFIKVLNCHIKLNKIVKEINKQVQTVKYGHIRQMVA